MYNDNCIRSELEMEVEITLCDDPAHLYEVRPRVGLSLDVLKDKEQLNYDE